MSGRTRSQNRSRGRSRSRSRGMMGGSHSAAAAVTNSGSTGGGAADWVIKNFGLGNAQWNNTFGPQSLGVENGNLLPTVVGAPAVLTGMTPQGQNVGAYTLKSLMSGGGRGRGGRGRGGRRRMKKTKGGMGMIETAAVPLTILALQQSYGTRRKGSRRKGSRRRGSRRGSRRR
jgi:hypothetical protein